MQQREELDWVGYVLRDVVTFLAKNDLMDSARMLAVAAAHIEHDMKREKPLPQPAVATRGNVVMFPRSKKPLA
jgi:hypothetical protein